MTPFEEILRRKRQRQPMDETLPDGTPAMAIVQRSQVQQRGFPTTDNPLVTATRPRRVTPPQSLNPADASHVNPDAQRQRAVTFNPSTGRPNEEYYRERNDPAGLYNAYQNWTPHGGKRGFKTALKAGALAASQIAQNTDDPTAILTGFGVGAVGGTVNPDLKNSLVRRFKLAQTGGELSNQLKLQKDQANVDASQMVPVTLDNGQTVMVPAKSAGALQSRQQDIDLRGNTVAAKINRWNQLGEHEAATEAQQLYNSGAADDSAELRAEIAKRLRLPAGTALPPRGLGSQIKVDELGNYVVINPRSGAVTDTSRGAFARTQEEGRDTRQTRALEGARERVQMQQRGATERAGMRGTGAARIDSATRRAIATHVGTIEGIKNELSALDAQIAEANKLPPNWTGEIKDADNRVIRTVTKNDRLASLGRRRQEAIDRAKTAAAELNELDPNNETGVGEGGYPYRKPRAAASDQQQSGGKYTGRRISRANVAEYGRRHGMTPEQAEQFLKREGATIY